MSTGTARGVERNADGKAVEDLAHDRLLDLEQLIRLLVVPRRPSAVAVADGDRVRLGPGAERVRRLEQLPDLAQPRERELAFVGAGVRAQERDSLQSDQIRQRMLEDGAIFGVGAGVRLLRVTTHF
ncbi:MAG TPA: hypothetical protein VNI55_06635 [Gaiellaceae bacterium]|nr:hypothetical protein [Gaiellaceae bacterium]